MACKCLTKSTLVSIGKQRAISYYCSVITMLLFSKTVTASTKRYLYCSRTGRQMAIQYNIRLLHRSQTATTSNMKHMNTKYNSRIT